MSPPSPVPSPGAGSSRTVPPPPGALLHPHFSLSPAPSPNPSALSFPLLSLSSSSSTIHRSNNHLTSTPKSSAPLGKSHLWMKPPSASPCRGTVLQKKVAQKPPSWPSQDHTLRALGSAPSCSHSASNPLLSLSFHGCKGKYIHGSSLSSFSLPLPGHLTSSFTGKLGWGQGWGASDTNLWAPTYPSFLPDAKREVASHPHLGIPAFLPSWSSPRCPALARPWPHFTSFYLCNHPRGRYQQPLGTA